MNKFTLFISLFLICLSTTNRNVYGQKHSDNIKQATISISNLEINSTCPGVNQTLKYSFNVNGVSVKGLWVKVEITFFDGTKNTIKNEGYANSSLDISGSYTIPSKLGPAQIEIFAYNYDPINQISYIDPTEYESITIDIRSTYLSISNISLSNTYANENMEFSFDVSGNIDKDIWVTAKVTFPNGTTQSVINQAYSGCFNTITGSVNLPSGTGNGAFQISVHKFDIVRNVSYECPHITENFVLSITENLTPGTANISNVSYKIPSVGTNIWTLHWGEEYNIEFDVTNSGETNVNVKCYSIVTPPGIDEEEMINGDYINSSYFNSNYIMHTQTLGVMEPGQTFSTVLFTDINGYCDNYGYYNLWIFTCNNGDNKVFDKKKKEFFYNTSVRPSKIIKPSPDKVAMNFDDNINVYPNPSNGIIYFDTNENLEGTIVNVYSITGAKVYSGTITTIENKINLGKVKNGFYIMELTNNEEKFHQKIQIKKH